ncbi:hypothetical protein NIES2119_20360 [[Phormidium ambiguum] IAM M-71]|uniref:Uncharacterized protein n=1 Tax=[Phormidium ambiguum] IAM M-71 TaxID=454136 RepID=A0A1U7IEM5_9CYAN|nr:hypothetical protein [Phormidium ambiguum]OKH35377.1 hypothetical protein NIES2119_20360 [Phormidium ambiguum IAM M-71]
MSQSTTSINTKLIDSLAQIILSLTDEEQLLLAQKIQYRSLSSEELQKKREALQCDIALGVEQLQNGDYAEYDDSTLPNLLDNIKMRGKQRLQEEQSQ